MGKIREKVDRGGKGRLVAVGFLPGKNQVNNGASGYTFCPFTSF